MTDCIHSKLRTIGGTFGGTPCIIQYIITGSTMTYPSYHFFITMDIVNTFLPRILCRRMIMFQFLGEVSDTIAA